MGRGNNMNSLLKSINAHKEKNNISVCYHLYKYIMQHKIESEEELKRAEDNMFTTDDIRIRNEINYNSYVADKTHFEKLDANDIAKLVDYEDLYEIETNELIKTKYLILIYEINEWELYFPYTAYQLIIRDMLQ